MATSNSFSRQVGTTLVKAAVTKGVQMSTGHLLGATLASTLGGPMLLTGILLAGASSLLNSIYK